MDPNKTVENRIAEKKKEVTFLFAKADAEFANGVNPLADAQVSSINSADQEMTDLLNQSTRICKRSFERIDQQGVDSLMAEYDRICKGGK
ncbi:MAG: hypothetical protein K6F32_01365 [Bacilli bacterium]|nr:hypothetical protein [Bacilli bacterium]